MAQPPGAASSVNFTRLKSQPWPRVMCLVCVGLAECTNSNAQQLLRQQQVSTVTLTAMLRQGGGTAAQQAMPHAAASCSLSLDALCV